MNTRIEMTPEERAIALQIGEPFAKLLREGGYLVLTRLLCDQFAVRRSKAGDLSGWTEEWMFGSEPEARLAFYVRLHGAAPFGWTRHVWADSDGSHLEYPDGLAR